MHRLVLALLSIVIVACSGTAGTVQSPTPAGQTATPDPVVTGSPTAAPTAATPTVFSSPLYHYTVTLPPAWKATAAKSVWDSTSSSGHDSPDVDKFVGPVNPITWAFAGPVSVDLDGFAQEQIDATAREHGDTCQAKPEVNEPVQIGGTTGRFLAWDCGILINSAIAVQAGVGYSFLMRDFYVHAATDPADRALFQEILDSVVFPS